MTIINNRTDKGKCKHLEGIFKTIWNKTYTKEKLYLNFREIVLREFQNFYKKKINKKFKHLPYRPFILL